MTSGRASQVGWLNERVKDQGALVVARLATSCERVRTYRCEVSKRACSDRTGEPLRTCSRQVFAPPDAPSAVVHVWCPRAVAYALDKDEPARTLLENVVAQTLGRVSPIGGFAHVLPPRGRVRLVLNCVSRAGAQSGKRNVHRERESASEREEELKAQGLHD